MQQGIKTNPTLVQKLRATFLKVNNIDVTFEQSGDKLVQSETVSRFQ